MTFNGRQYLLRTSKDCSARCTFCSFLGLIAPHEKTDQEILEGLEKSRFNGFKRTVVSCQAFFDGSIDRVHDLRFHDLLVPASLPEIAWQQLLSRLPDGPLQLVPLVHERISENRFRTLEQRGQIAAVKVLWQGLETAGILDSIPIRYRTVTRLVMSLPQGDDESRFCFSSTGSSSGSKN